MLRHGPVKAAFAAERAQHLRNFARLRGDVHRPLRRIERHALLAPREEERRHPQEAAQGLGTPREISLFGVEQDLIVAGRFFRQDDQLIADARRLAGIPGVIIQGRYDVVTPAVTAWDLHKAWPQAEFIMVQDAGHTATEPGIADALVRATDRFRHCIRLGLGGRWSDVERAALQRVGHLAKQLA